MLAAVPGCQIGAWASIQSQAIERPADLADRVAEYERKFEGKEVTRPPFWSGFRVAPERIEFWHGKLYRRHHRIIYMRNVDGWQTQWLYP